jgi:DNA-binding NarL/FixJ family response regulator
MPTKIVIYEDNSFLRESFELFLTKSANQLTEYSLLGIFPNALDVVTQVKALQPDIILMDIDMPGGVSGIEAVKKIRVFDQQTPIIMITVFDDRTNVLDAMASGASGYLLKKYLSERLHETISDVLKGGAPMSPSIARMVVESMHRYAPLNDNIYNLTPRERDILLALSQGFGYKIIADKHFISIDTVRTHIKKIYSKMQVHSQLEAVIKGKNARII